MSMVLQLLLTLPVGSCSCEAVELSFSCLRRLKTWSKEGRRVCGKGTTFTVLWTNQTLSLCLLCYATLAAMTAVCEIFNCYIFGRRPKGGGAWPNGKYASAFEFDPLTFPSNNFVIQRKQNEIARILSPALPLHCTLFPSFPPFH